MNYSRDASTLAVEIMGGILLYAMGAAPESGTGVELMVRDRQAPRCRHAMGFRSCYSPPMVSDCGNCLGVDHGGAADAGPRHRTDAGPRPRRRRAGGVARSAAPSLTIQSVRYGCEPTILVTGRFRQKPAREHSNRPSHWKSDGS